MTGWGTRDERWILGRRLPRERPSRRMRFTLRGLLLALLGIGAAIALLVLTLDLVQGPGRGADISWTEDPPARLPGETDIDDASRPGGFQGEQDLSWSVCDPVIGSAGEVSSSSVDVSGEGRWTILLPGDDIPIWSGTFAPVAFGDVTGDGVDEAIVLTTCTTGASAQPWDLVIFQGTPRGSRLIAVLDEGLAAHYGRTLTGDVEAVDGTITYEVLVAADELEPGDVRRIRMVHRWGATSLVSDVEELEVEDYWG